MICAYELLFYINPMHKTISLYNFEVNVNEITFFIILLRIVWLDLFYCSPDIHPFCSNHMVITLFVHDMTLKVLLLSPSGKQMCIPKNQCRSKSPLTITSSIFSLMQTCNHHVKQRLRFGLAKKLQLQRHCTVPLWPVQE